MRQSLAITFASGGFKGLAYLGAWKVIQSSNRFNVVSVSGTSIGSVFALVACLQMEASALQSLIHIHKLYHNVCKFKPCPTYLLDHQALFDFLVLLLDLHDMAPTLTFGELYLRTGIFFSVCACKLDDHEPVYFDVFRSPEEPVLNAIRASIAVPLLFPCFSHASHGDLIDGHFVDPLPYEQHPVGIEKYLSLQCEYKREPNGSSMHLFVRFIRLVTRKFWKVCLCPLTHSVKILVPSTINHSFFVPIEPTGVDQVIEEGEAQMRLEFEKFPGC